MGIRLWLTHSPGNVPLYLVWLSSPNLSKCLRVELSGRLVRKIRVVQKRHGSVGKAIAITGAGQILVPGPVDVTSEFASKEREEFSKIIGQGALIWQGDVSPLNERSK